MTKVLVALTEPSFIHGVLRPVGYQVEVDEGELGAKVGSTATPAAKAELEPTPLTPNLQRIGAAPSDPIEYQVGAVSPTGPNPTMPQATPPGAQPTGNGTFAVPIEPGNTIATAAVVPEKPAKAK